jgi:4-amino-4-deoxy-L-arabinose transferase-like glycosyltransferase
VLLAAGALVVRLAYLALFDPVVRPISDGSTYRLLANHLADGHGFVSPYEFAITGAERATAEFPPLHPLVLAVAALVGATSVAAQQVAMAVVGTATPVLTAVLGHQVTGSRRLALAAGALAAVHPLLIGSEGALMAETTYTVATAATLVAVLAAVRGGGIRGWAVVGALVGLTALARSEGLLLVPLVVVPVVVLARRWSWREIVLRVAVVGCVALAVLSPWVIRNALRFDGQLILSNNLGGLLNGANCPASYEGDGLGSWTFTCYERVPLPRDEAAASAVLRDAALEYIGDNLDRLPVVVPARVLRTWGLYRPVDQARAEVSEGRVYGPQVAGVVAGWFVLPLFAAGVIGLRRAGRPVAVLIGVVAMVTLASALSYGSVRFRQVAEPVLLVGAVCGVATLVGAARDRRVAGDAADGSPC